MPDSPAWIATARQSCTFPLQGCRQPLTDAQLSLPAGKGDGGHPAKAVGCGSVSPASPSPAQAEKGKHAA